MKNKIVFGGFVQFNEDGSVKDWSFTVNGDFNPGKINEYQTQLYNAFILKYGYHK